MFADRQAHEIYDRLNGLLIGYRSTLAPDRRHLLDQFQLVHIARKVVGVGSVGTGAWVALLVDRDLGTPLVLQAKEAESSVLERFTRPSEYENHGERVVVGQRLMQAASDIFLGWLHADEGPDGRSRDYYVRQLKDWKGSAETEQMSPKALATYGRMCGWTLARAHARTGDAMTIAGYLGKGKRFAEAMTTFAMAYADQTVRDHRVLAASVLRARAGRLRDEGGPNANWAEVGRLLIESYRALYKGVN